VPTALHTSSRTVFNKGEADYLYEEIIEEDTYALLAEDSFVGALPEAPVVFDVGANMGMFSVAILKRYPQARLFAFEPIPALHAICSKNVQLHSSGGGGKDESVGDSAAATTQSRCYRMGLSDAKGQANFDFYPHFSLWTHTHDGAGMGDARQTRLQQDVPAMIRDAQGTGKLPAWTRACPSSLLVCLGRRLVRFLGGGRINVLCELGVMSDIIRNEGVKRVDLLKVGGGGRVWLYTQVWGGGEEGTVIYIYVREGCGRSRGSSL
jgi:FkbM family methyltransferase